MMPPAHILKDLIADLRIAASFITIVPVTSPLPPPLLPFVLRLPDGLFRVLAARMLKIDPQARSSMWEDLERGRPTEVDVINGEVVRLAQSHHVGAPVNARLVELIHAAEQARRPWTAQELLDDLESRATP